jgi:hypothetical protein
MTQLSTRRRYPSVAAAALVALVGPWATVAGQQDTLAAIRGTVTSSTSGRPISGVMIAVPAVARFVVTDSTGTFALGGLPAGRQRIRISYLERGSEEYDVTLRRGQARQLAVLLDMEAVDLAPIVVEGWGGRFARSLAGFYDRKRRSFGRFYTAEDIERIGPVQLSSLLRREGIRIVCRGWECVAYSGRDIRPCPMDLYLDGVWVDSTFLDTIHPNDVAAVEIYRSGGNIPLAFLFGGDSRCGVIAVWRRT